MNLALIVGWALQITSAILVFIVFRGGAFRRLGIYLILAVITYHGLTEVVQRFAGFSDMRSAAQPEYVAGWVLLSGAALLCFSLVYVAVSSRRADVREGGLHLERGRLLRVLDWRILGLLSIPLLATIASGAYQGGAAAAQGAKVTVTTSTGLAGQFLVPLLVLTTISFVASGSNRRLGPGFLLEMLAFLLTGSRQSLLAGAGMTLFGLMLLGRRPTRRQVIIGLAVVALLGLAVNTSRAQVGRDRFNQASSATERIKVLAEGDLAALKGDEPLYASSSTQSLGSRIDGNTFPSAVLAELDRGKPVLGLTTFLNDVRLAVPSFLNKQKLSQDVTTRSEKVYIKQAYGLGLPIDFLPTQMGAMLPYYGPWGLPLLMGLLGLLFAAGDRLMTRPTMVGFLVPLGLLQCALYYEQSMDVYPLAARGLAVILLVASGISFLRFAPARARERKQAARPAWPTGAGISVGARGAREPTCLKSAVVAPS